MAWPNQELRRLLALLSKPDKLEKFPLAVQLKEALDAPTARDAVLQVIDNAFSVRTPLNDALREAILRCDVDGKKTFHAATTLNVSPRTLFRRRSAAIASVAAAVDQILQNADSQSQFKYTIARMIAPVESTTAVQLFEREAVTMGGRAAYEAICTTLRNGRDVSESLLNQCTGHWRLLAQLEIARTNLVRGRPALYGNMRAGIRSSLDRFRGVPYERVEYELAYVDRLDAIRRCDVDASGKATRRMSETAGRDSQLVTFALVCEAEQACDEGDIARAEALIRKLEILCLRMRDFRITARTSHVAGILHFLRGQFEETIELCNATAAALAQVEPEFAACSAANAGRAALFVGQPWARPLDLCNRFPQCYVNGQIDSVWARHLVSSDPQLALAAVDRAVAITSSQEAWGILAYARGTRSLILDLMNRGDEAQVERVAAWEEAVRLRRVFYLFDLFVHPAQRSRIHGPFEIDERFTQALGRRFLSLADGTVDYDDLRKWINPTIIFCLNAARESFSDATGARERFLASRLMPRAMNRFDALARQKVEKCFLRLAIDLAYCLPPVQRARFIERFASASANLCSTVNVVVFPSSVAN